MNSIVALARKWLVGEHSTATSQEISSHKIIEDLLAEIHRIEEVNVRLAGECQRLRLEGAKEISLAVAEECAVICETADYAVRSYGCAHEIRIKFGLPMKKR